jgi:hypothetical protein
MPCSICGRTTDVAAIDSLLDAGETLTVVSKQFNTSRFALARHLKHRKSEAEAPISATQAEISKWLARADLEYEKASQDDDIRSANASIASALRCIETQLRTAEKEKEVTEEAGEDDVKISISNLDDVCAMFDQAQASDDPVDQAQIKITLDKARLLCKPDMVAVFYRAYENLRFAEDLLTWAATWEPEKKGNSDGPVQTGRCAN